MIVNSFCIRRMALTQFKTIRFEKCSSLVCSSTTSMSTMSFDADSDKQDDSSSCPRTPAARPHSIPPNRISLVLPAQDGDAHGGGRPASTMVDNYDLEESTGDDDYTLSDKMVHYVGGYITQDHWHACKAVLAFHAGCAVCKLSPMTKVNMQNMCLEAYKAAVADLDQLHFGSDARAFFLSSFRKREDAMTGESLYRYFQDSRNKMRSILVPLLPPEFMTMKSGRGFHETCKEVIIKEFRRDRIRGTNCREGVTHEEADQMLPPMYWQYKGQPWTYFLCVQIFRRHPQLAPNVADVLDDISNVPMSRAATKRKAQMERYNKSKLQMIAAAPAVSVPAAAVRQEPTEVETITQKHTTWAKVHMAKAMEENANVTRKLGEIEALEKTLAILEKNRHVIGDAEYDARVRDILFSLPNPKSFAKECVVICIGDGDDNLGNDLGTTSVDEQQAEE